MTVAPAILGAWFGWALSGNIHTTFLSALMFEGSWHLLKLLWKHRGETAFTIHIK